MTELLTTGAAELSHVWTEPFIIGDEVLSAEHGQANELFNGAIIQTAEQILAKKMDESTGAPFNMQQQVSVAGRFKISCLVFHTALQNL